MVRGQNESALLGYILLAHEGNAEHCFIKQQDIQRHEKVIGGMILYLAVIEWLHCDLSFMH